MTVEQFQRAAGVKAEIAEKWHPHIVAALQQFDITTPRRIAAFIAQTGHESGGFTRIVESFNYSITGLAIFSQLTVAQREALGRHADERGLPVERQRAIANLAYAGHLGNKSPDDGWKFRGRGLIQLTGLDNYLSCGRALGIDLITSPELLESPQYAALSAGWFWSENKLNSLADIGDIVKITRRINSGMIGLAERQALYKQALRAVGAA
ncbi:glycoside hydrolase family 19 protein [Dickeya oryzae]|uniref:Glycoside hydrolase family 19 protein n=1 Tax=Dickeya oryzae TaxID=1240404 RepID=A0AB39IFS0_9GAMM|nr:glycoside hydrolase family 19 protein [Dickeya oryzae]MCA6993562.1 glycoside hydrolase family 19 protein [Dickeya oryzae]